MKVKQSIISKRFLPVLAASTLSTMSTYILMLTDSIIAGNMIGTDAVMAITLISPIVSFILFVCYVLSSGTALAASYHRGRADDAAVNNVFSHGMAVSVEVGILMCAVMFLFKDQLLSIWHISRGAMAYAEEYYTGVILLPLFMGVNLLLYGLFIGKGKEKMCFAVGITEAVVNVGLSLLLTPKVGIIGISGSSTISMAAGTAVFVGYYLLVMRKKTDVFKWNGTDLKTLKDILLIGFNDSMDGFLMIFLPGTVSLYLIYTFGADNILIFTVVINAINLIGAFLAGLADTMELLVCLYYGENNLHGVKQIIKMSLKIVFYVSVFIVVGFLIFANNIPLLYGITDPASRLEAARALRIFTVYLPFYCVEYTYFEYYGCVGHTAYSILSLALLIYVLPVACMIAGGAAFGIYGAWMGMGFGYVVSFAVDMLMARQIGKKKGALQRGEFLLTKKDLDQQFFYDIEASADNVSRTAEAADAEFARADIPYKARTAAEVIMEEMGMQAVQRQEESSFMIEYTAMFNDEPTLIIRDNGEKIDEIRAAKELRTASLRSDILANLAGSAESKYNPAGENNRTIYHLEKNDDSL